MPPRSPNRDALIGAVGGGIAGLQDASNMFDDAAAAALVIDRPDLPLLTALLFQGSLSNEQLAASVARPSSALRVTLARLEIAGYIQRPGGGRVELTAFAREWIETLWGPLQREGAELVDASFTTANLSRIARFLDSARQLQERQTARVRALLEVPRAKNRRRGGLSPAALRRVQLFVEANLEKPFRLDDLAERAGLSKFHFAHAFKISTGTTPRAFAASRRIERAKQLLRESSATLAGIAITTGFGTQSRFTTVFRRATGLTPAAFRRAEV